jgi:hypothetical protein
MRHLGFELDKSKLELICEDEGGKYQWFYDAAYKRYICIHAKENKFTYLIPAVDLEKLFCFRKPRSQAVLKLCEHDRNKRIS